MQRLLDDYCPEVEVVAMAEDVLSGVKLINQHQPDMVFLDIEMPSYSGFKLIEFFDEIDFEIIFTTAYEQHAVRAFKVSALAYLLKPINIDELIDAVQRVWRLRREGTAKEIQPSLTPSSPKALRSRLVLPSVNGLLYLQVDEITHLESEGRYTKVYLCNGDPVVTSQSLKECQKMLEKSLFLRIHRSYIINLSWLKRYSKGRDSHVILETGHRIDVGKNFKEELTEVVALFEK